MSSKHTSRTVRRLIKLASLGLAGLLAGLLAGCSASPRTIGMTSYADSAAQLHSTTLPENLDLTSIPALRHAPSARRLEYGSVRLNHPSTPTHDPSSS
jgi:hypothetical protein